ncbi:MAG: porin [Aestuariivita sp.]|nr:porin [Aestuariivita sp.]
MTAADVTFGGLGRFGVDYNEANKPKPDTNEVNLTSRLRLQVDMSAESNAGVMFSARFRAQAEERDGNQKAASWNSGHFGVGINSTVGTVKLEFENISGAIDSMPIYLPTKSVATGIDGMGFYSQVVRAGFDGYSSDGAGANNGVNLKYSMGPLGVHVSHSGTGGNDERTAAHVSYKIGGFTVAVGGQNGDKDNEDVTVATLGGNLGFMEAGVGYSQNKNFAANGDDVDKVRVYGKITVSSATNLVLWGADEDPNGTNNARDGGSFGIDLSHDLGGDVTFVAGFVDSNDDNQQAQAGVYFNF